MDDLISRQAAIDALGEAPEVWTDSPEEFAALNQWEMDVTAIEAVPSADRPTGKWIKTHDETSSERNFSYKCSECGCLETKIYYRGYKNNEWSDYLLEYKFCPNCGAKMVREDGEA